MAAAATHILGIETSCDETAAAVVRRHGDGSGEIVSNIVLSQIEDHAPYGGVVPEIAARVHIRHLDRLIAQAMEEAGITFPMLDGGAAHGGRGAFWAALSSGLPPPRPLPWPMTTLARHQSPRGPCAYAANVGALSLSLFASLDFGGPYAVSIGRRRWSISQAGDYN